MAYSAEKKLLMSNGFDVITYERSNDEINKPSNAAINLIWSHRTYKDVRALIRKEKPDIAHFHNIWYLISPSAYTACRDAGLPVVQTLHNFRMFCSNGLLMRNGRVCEKCVGTVPWRGAFYGCFRNSRLYSLPVAVAEIAHKLKSTWADMVDMYIALTGFGRQKFIQCGLPAEKIVVKPNFLLSPPKQPFTFNSYAIYMGRLSGEKGIQTLIDASRELPDIRDFSIMILGDGPLRPEIEARIRDEKLKFIKIVGLKSHEECMNMLTGARFLLFPSLCYENFPMAVAEAFACGKPVIASNLGAMTSIIEDMKTGLLFEPGNASDLAEKIRWMIGNEDKCLEMGENARAEFESEYTAEHNFELLMNIYRSVLSERAKSG